MSSRREVLIRILALLQRKTLIETKNRTLKCLKWHYSTVRSMKNVAALTENGAFALFFRPHPGGFDSSRVPSPGNLPSKAKKMLKPGGQLGGEPRGGGGDGHSWNWLMHYMNTFCECILKKIGLMHAHFQDNSRKLVNVVRVRFTMMYSSRKLNNKKVITTACNFWGQIACSFQVYGRTIARN